MLNKICEVYFDNVSQLDSWYIDKYIDLKRKKVIFIENERVKRQKWCDIIKIKINWSYLQKLPWMYNIIIGKWLREIVKGVLWIYGGTSVEVCWNNLW